MEQTVVAIDFKERILKMRGEHVILDKDIAQLYGVTTGALNQAVKRNINRFFEITNCDNKSRKRGISKSPICFY